MHSMDNRKRPVPISHAIVTNIYTYALFEILNTHFGIVLYISFIKVQAKVRANTCTRISKGTFNVFVNSR